MPVIFVHGTPPGVDPTPLINELIAAVTSVKELELKREAITIFFPPDLVKRELGMEIVVMVHGLFIKPKRTRKVRKDLSIAINNVVAGFFMGPKSPTVMVETMIVPFDESNGYSITRK